MIHLSIIEDWYSKTMAITNLKLMGLKERYQLKEQGPSSKLTSNESKQEFQMFQNFKIT